jgi:hypothetical protein
MVEAVSSSLKSVPAPALTPSGSSLTSPPRSLPRRSLLPSQQLHLRGSQLARVFRHRLQRPPRPRRPQRLLPDRRVIMACPFDQDLPPVRLPLQRVRRPSEGSASFVRASLDTNALLSSVSTRPSENDVKATAAMDVDKPAPSPAPSATSWAIDCSLPVLSR